MKRLLILLLAALALPTAVNAEISDKVHNRCKDVKDYIGCVKINSDNLTQKRIIIDEGIALSEGNACPSGMAYIGGGTCRQVTCTGRISFFAKHDPLLAGKNWKCRYAGVLLFGEVTAKTFNQPKCPENEPGIGWNNTCKQNAGESGLGIDPVGDI